MLPTRNDGLHFFNDVNTPAANRARRIVNTAGTLTIFSRPLALLLTFAWFGASNAFGFSGSPFPTNGTGFFKMINTGLAILLFLVSAFGVAMLALAGYNYWKEGSIAKSIGPAVWSLGAWTVVGGLIYSAANGEDVPTGDLDIGR